LFSDIAGYHLKASIERCESCREKFLILTELPYWKRVLAYHLRFGRGCAAAQKKRRGRARNWDDGRDAEVTGAARILSQSLVALREVAGCGYEGDATL